LKRKLTLSYLIFFFNCIVTISQTFSSGNLYNETPYLLNPAYAGYKGTLSSNINYLQINTNIEGAPTQLSFGINSPVYKNMSLGGRFFKQSEGLFENISVFIDYSYNLKINDSQSLRFGFATGLKSNQINSSEIIAQDPSAIIDVASRNYKGIFFQSAAGLAYNWKKLDLALLVPQLFESKNILNPDICSYAAYRIEFAQNPISVRPSVLLTYNTKKPLLFDIGFTTYWKKQFFVGVIYRNRPGIIFSAGFNLKDISLSYAIELGLQKQSNIFNQVHEITLSYSFRKKKTPTKDTITIQNNQLIVKNDTIKKDTTHLVRNIKTDSVIISNVIENKQDSNIISVNVNKDTSLTNVVLNVTDTSKINNQKDSTISIKINTREFNDSDINKYEIISVGNGLYSIKTKKNNSDSLLNSENTENEMINNSEIIDKIMDKISKNQNITEDNSNKDDILYTIQLFINESNNYILRDAEIALDAWFETDKSGKFIYYFGHYKSTEEAKNKLTKFEKYSNLKTEIIKLSN
jgi:type IX secretion system PorP/SprF family membrane protein